MSPIGVMHLIDTLEVGGAEQMAMSLANLLPRDQFEPHLCTTRHEGPLAAAVGPDVGRLRLGVSAGSMPARWHAWFDTCGVTTSSCSMPTAPPCSLPRPPRSLRPGPRSCGTTTSVGTSVSVDLGRTGR